MIKQNLLRATAAAFVFLPVFSYAAMGTVATNFGLLPQDVATAQSLSMFSNQPSAVYYNPAYLARDRKGQVSAAYLFTDQDIKARPRNFGEDNFLQNEEIVNRSNYNVLLGFKTDLSSMLKSDRAMVLGIMLGAERSGERLLSFDSQTSETAQSFRYGQQSLFLSLGAGLNVVPGFDVGASTRITLAADANLEATANVQGDTSRERLVLTAKPSIQPILSGSINWAQLLCEDPKACWAYGLETALAWRYESKVSVGVNADAAVRGLVNGLPLRITTFDGYQPEMFTAGINFDRHRARIGATGEYQLWSGLNRQIEGDTIRGDAGLRFRDVFVPRIGGEFRLNPVFSLLSGISYEQSPLSSRQSLDVNFVDSDRVVFGLGFSYLIEQALFLSQPVRMDFAYQYHHLMDRDFIVASSRTDSAGGTCPDNPNARCQPVTSSGSAHVINASLNLSF